jgi:hypothetical protein
VSDIEMTSARMLKNFRRLREERNERAAYAQMVDWSRYRDTFSGDDKERVIFAATAVLTHCSDRALEVMKEVTPLGYEVYVRVKKKLEEE